MNKYLFSIAVGFLMFFMIVSCQNEAKKNTTFSKKAFEFQEHLSDYHFFEGPMAGLQPANGVLPYELNTALFSDYAHKARFIKLPEGESMNYADGELNFPEGTILIKNFFYYHDETKLEQGRRIIETRLLIKQAEEWKVANYEWNEAQTDAVRNILGGKKAVSWVNHAGTKRDIEYVIPDNNDCKSCHKQDGYVIPIGPKINNLNTSILTDGKSKNQLEHWASLGALNGLGNMEGIPQLPVWDEHDGASLTERARAYLDVNCAHCHSRQGPASNTGLFLNYTESDPHRIGVFKGPVSAAQGSGNLKYNIVPGNPDQSIMHFRMNSAETGIAMPEVGKTIVHEEGVQLIAEWIEEMEK